ncbi:aldose epimerase family protein [Nocardia sp. CDC160]|uniref:aldose epimerase family protein n=1 Tax=Nocardia sp. CDC160 TaxID=3112166 RepID=UPI002DBCC61D|nr:aldose 1-epimerase [Nocardia sp. CDC160]MEC3917953.1 aldose 1-epimerase [Nocardia sp. CDC160]
MSQHDILTLETADVRLRLAPRRGGRITGLEIGGRELLRQGDRYGCFPMAPWCGRLAEGRLVTDAGTYELPRNAAPHAIHGTVRDGVWEVTEQTKTTATLVQSLTAPWPFPGRVTQRFTLTEDGLELGFEVAADADPFPAQAGWHPWFNRSLESDGEPVRIDFTPSWQELRGPDYLPTGERIAPRPGPWDDCFGMPDGVLVALTWPGQLRLTVRSPEQWVVVYDMEPEAVCVEPQSGPPNGLNTMPRMVSPQSPLTVEASWSWERF